MPIHKNPLKIARSAELKHRFQRINAFLILIIKTDNPTFIRIFVLIKCITKHTIMEQHPQLLVYKASAGSGKTFTLAVQYIKLLIEDTSRETTAQFMKMNRYVDVLIPRGGAGLIRAVVENSTIPVIETGTGNCHIYVDETADLSMAVDIILNAKTQRVGVCNACESIVVHENVREKLLPVLEERLKEKHVEMRRKL